ncbi:MAG: hypothetical protein HY763_04145 [Planctomycetes bacterium]|nr:hypothetical protein [Planctomycetota bacterium]
MTMPPVTRRLRHWLSSVAVIAGIAVSGCVQPTRPIFEPPNPAIQWPDPPAPARVRYLGQITGEKDLKAPRKPFQGLGELVVGARKPADLYGPRAVACTPDGRHVWVADPGGRCLHRFDLQAREYQKIVTAGTAPLLTPVGLGLGPEGSVYVCDSESIAIHRYAAATGAFLGSLSLPEELYRPVALYYRPVEDDLLVVDVVAHDVKILGRDGSLRRILGRRGTAPGEFNFPSAITCDGDTVWIADTGNHRLQRLNASGGSLASYGQAGDAPGDLALPKGVAVDSDGHVYVVDGRFENVQVFDAQGRLLLFFGEEGSGPGQFWLPAGIFVDALDRVWVCDGYNRRLQVFQYLRADAGKPGTEVQP